MSRAPSHAPAAGLAGVQPALRRRALLRAAGAGAAACALPLVRAQEPQARPVAVAQIVDLSAPQQDVSRDFLIGSRAAWADFNARGGLRGQAVQHLVLETDGSPERLRQAWQAAHDEPACVALSGCAADGAAATIAALQAGGGALARAGTFLTVDDALVEQADLGAGNGVVHVIDRVLMSPRK